MNFVGHALVAAAVHPHADAILGAMAPDLLPHSGARAAQPLPDAVEEGRRLHHASDAAFHRHPTFLHQQRRVFDHLHDAGIPRGPARAAAHLSVELLLDGMLLAHAPRPAFTDAWGRLRTQDAVVRSLVEPVTRTAWSSFLTAFTTHIEPARYADVAYSAARIERLLHHRPRLSLAPSHGAALRTAMAAVAPAVHDAADEIIADVCAALPR